jgi:hypothetical protein
MYQGLPEVKQGPVNGGGKIIGCAVWVFIGVAAALIVFAVSKAGLHVVNPFGGK